MAVERVSFGNMPDGREVYKYVITNDNEYSASVITLGATLQALYCEDAAGELRDVVLGFDSVEDYLEKSSNQGCTVGPYANRIGGASMDVNGKHYELAVNENGSTCLHSNGDFGFSLWSAIVVDSDAVEFSYTSPDGTNGFPGETTAKVTYRLDAKNALHITYDAVSTRDTYINLTNHSYFNLDGYDFRDILGHSLMIDSDFFTEVDKLSIPTGQQLPVENTPFDFRSMKKIGLEIGADHVQLGLTGGYDHNFCIRGFDGKLRKIACAEAEASGIAMNVYTDLPGVQFYAGNYLKGDEGKNAHPMNKRSGFCLETQYYPDTPHQSSFPSCLFKAGDRFVSETVYEFFVNKV